MPHAYDVGDYVMLRYLVTTPGINKKFLPKFQRQSDEWFVFPDGSKMESKTMEIFLETLYWVAGFVC